MDVGSGAGLNSDSSAHPVLLGEGSLLATGGDSRESEVVIPTDIEGKVLEVGDTVFAIGAYATGPGRIVEFSIDHQEESGVTTEVVYELFSNGDTTVRPCEKVKKVR